MVNIELLLVLGYSTSFKVMVYHWRFCYDNVGLSNDYYYPISDLIPYRLNCFNFVDFRYSKDDKAKVKIHCQLIDVSNV